MPSVMRRSGVSRGTQSDQKAQGQDGTHRIFSSQPAMRDYVGQMPHRTNVQRLHDQSHWRH
jgi:hypothetical protein